MSVGVSLAVDCLQFGTCQASHQRPGNPLRRATCQAMRRCIDANWAKRLQGEHRGAKSWPHIGTWERNFSSALEFSCPKLSFGSGKSAWPKAHQAASLGSDDEPDESELCPRVNRAWIDVIEAFLSKRDRVLPDSVLVGELLHECADGDYLLRFYTKERLLSEEARSRSVMPDLAPIGAARRRPASSLEGRQ